MNINYIDVSDITNFMLFAVVEATNRLLINICNI